MVTAFAFAGLADPVRLLLLHHLDSAVPTIQDRVPGRRYHRKLLELILQPEPIRDRQLDLLHIAPNLDLLELLLDRVHSTWVRSPLLPLQAGEYGADGSLRFRET